MKIFNAILNWLKQVNEESKAIKKERQAKELENLSCEQINVIEFLL